MSTIMSPPPEAEVVTAAEPSNAPAGSMSFTGDQRIVLRNISWELYDRLSDAIGEGSSVYVAYDGKDLELMTTGMLHDDFKDLIGRFFNAMTFELEIPCKGTAQVTWKRPEIERGLEADQSYYFSLEKLEIAARSRADGSNDVADYPNPDVAIEVDISPSRVDRQSIYAALGVSEVWRFDGETLTIEWLQADGSYSSAETSRFLPVRSEEVVPWLLERIVDVNAWERKLRAWIRAEILPRTGR